MVDPSRWTRERGVYYTFQVQVFQEGEGSIFERRLFGTERNRVLF